MKVKQEAAKPDIPTKLYTNHYRDEWAIKVSHNLNDFQVCDWIKLNKAIVGVPPVKSGYETKSDRRGRFYP